MRIYTVKQRSLAVETDLHDQIMIELVKYFQANELWETKGWEYKAVEARNALANLRLSARKRRIEIQDKRKQIVRVKYKKKKGESNE